MYPTFSVSHPTSLLPHPPSLIPPPSSPSTTFLTMTPAFSTPASLPYNHAPRPLLLSPQTSRMSTLPIQYSSIPAAATFKPMQAVAESITPSIFSSPLPACGQPMGPSTHLSALRTLLGNAHLFESDWLSLNRPVTRYQASGNAREFVRDVAKSHAFTSRYFQASTNTRFVELAYKLFLARSPSTQSEASAALCLLVTQGYDNFVDWIVDSEEYAHKFGSTLVPKMGPYAHYKGGMPAFNATMRLQLPTRGANSDVTCTTPQTMNVLAAGNPAGCLEIRQAYHVTVPKYEPHDWMKLPISCLLTDWSAFTLVMSDAVDSWSGLGRPRATGEAKAPWQSGWKPTSVAQQWTPGWFGSTKKYV